MCVEQKREVRAINTYLRITSMWKIVEATKMVEIIQAEEKENKYKESIQSN